MPVVQLTPSFINNLTTQIGKARTEWCDKNCPGLYVEARATAPGKGTFYLRYKDAAGVTRHWKLGTTADLSLAAARAAAKEKQAEIRLGADPRKAEREQKAVPTLRTFVEEQYLPYVELRKRSYLDDRNRLRQRILPLFGDRVMNTISRKEWVNFHLSLRTEAGLAPATCDRFLSLARYLYNLALQWGVVTENPLTSIALYLENNQIENYLTESQLSCFLAVLQTYKDRTVARFFLFLLSTGARCNEGLTATWSQFDLEQCTWRIPASTAKAKKVRAVALNATAMAVLLEQQPDPALRSGDVFLRPGTNKRIRSVQRPWQNIRTAAGLPHLRIHDLRHCFASMLVNAGQSLYIVQAALGHSSPNVTQRYAHLSTKTLQDAAAIASGSIQAAMPKLLPAPPTQDQ